MALQKPQSFCPPYSNRSPERACEKSASVFVPEFLTAENPSLRAVVDQHAHKVMERPQHLFVNVLQKFANSDEGDQHDENVLCIQKRTFARLRQTWTRSSAGPRIRQRITLTMEFVHHEIERIVRCDHNGNLSIQQMQRQHVVSHTLVILEREPASSLQAIEPLANTKSTNTSLPKPDPTHPAEHVGKSSPLRQPTKALLPSQPAFEISLACREQHRYAYHHLLLHRAIDSPRGIQSTIED